VGQAFPSACGQDELADDGDSRGLCMDGKSGPLATYCMDSAPDEKRERASRRSKQRRNSLGFIRARTSATTKSELCDAEPKLRSYERLP